MKIAVTGAGGFLGWHVRCALHAAGMVSVPLTRETFSDAASLAAALRDVDAVVHAAGANRGEDNEVAATNVWLARALADACAGMRTGAQLIHLNSTHIDRETAYGASKREASRILSDAAGPENVLDLVLPGVFGEHARPYYNSVVSTFCHQLAIGEQLSINDDAEVELVHAQDVADEVISAIVERRAGCVRMTGRRQRVSEVATLLTSLHDSYSANVVPAIGDPFDRSMFNTLRSYRFPALYPISLQPRTDQRGRLVELVKADTGGQLFMSTTHPGVTRGNHYHRRKIERFAVVEGTATISLRRLLTNEVTSFEVKGDDPVAIDMPTMHTHNITNVGSSTLVTTFWSDEIFDPDHPDTYPETV